MTGGGGGQRERTSLARRPFHQPTNPHANRRDAIEATRRKIPIDDLQVPVDGGKWIFYNMLLLTLLRVARSCQPQPLSLSAAEC